MQLVKHNPNEKNSIASLILSMSPGAEHRSGSED